MEVEKINYKETHKQVEYIQKTFSDNDVKIKSQSFLYKPAREQG